METILALVIALLAALFISAPFFLRRGPDSGDESYYADPRAEKLWRKELRAHLEKIQQADGSWVNDKNSRWMEDLAFLCTCYAMTALELCR